jgi:uncharacterized protein YneF (UPF0154 family)
MRTIVLFIMDSILVKMIFLFIGILLGKIVGQYINKKTMEKKNVM